MPSCTRGALPMLLAALVSGCSSAAGTSSDEPKLIKSAVARSAMPSGDNVPALGSSNRAFAFDLYHQLAAESQGTNLLFSPYSISTAFAMTYAGARGTTESEIKTVMHYDLEGPALHEAFNATDVALQSRAQGQAGVDGSPFKLNVDNSIFAQG